MPYSCFLVRFDWKIAAVLPAFLWLGAGCGGINVSKSISPASFLLPGLLQADPPAANPDRALPAAEPVNEVAQN